MSEQEFINSLTFEPVPFYNREGYQRGRFAKEQANYTSKDGHHIKVIVYDDDGTKGNTYIVHDAEGIKLLLSNDFNQLVQYLNS